jgi:O-antigen biosynthesis protein
VLTSQASLPVWRLEASVEETIVFDFFHARSAFGELDLSEEDWRQLRDRLEPQHFDLAIDLRKHAETRPTLQHTGARYLAGFDFRNQFPWLDVAIEWGGDQIYARKRQHTADDLINLVDAVVAAGEPDRTVVAARPPSFLLPPALRPGRSATGPIVCVHPMAGNDMKQWPIANFAAVIDRLAEEADARVVVIGAPGEESIGDELLALLRHRNAAISLAGKVPLAELPGLISGCALFLGNDSGPKHIAAGLGVPTVGVHAGTVDVREWGPVGPAAVAVARSVICSPCYLSHPEDCRRGVICIQHLEPAKVYEACRRLLLLGLGIQPSTNPVGAPSPVARRTKTSAPRRSRRLMPPAAGVSP